MGTSFLIIRLYSRSKFVTKASLEVGGGFTPNPFAVTSSPFTDDPFAATSGSDPFSHPFPADSFAGTPATCLFSDDTFAAAPTTPDPFAVTPPFAVARSATDPVVTTSLFKDDPFAELDEDTKKGDLLFDDPA